jgi:AraC family transcriptional regulator
MPDAGRQSLQSQMLTWLGSRLGWELRRSDTAAGLGIDGVIHEMLAEVARARSSYAETRFPIWLQTAKDYIHGNYTLSFTVSDVACIAGVHPAHLAKVFRQKLGCTIGDYVRRLRVEASCQQILKTKMRLCDVAINEGFSDQSHMSREFRRFIGVSPNAYRRLHRNTR